nr:hypothetical protein CFP56_29896 [Quercus suber]
MLAPPRVTLICRSSAPSISNDLRLSLSLVVFETSLFGRISSGFPISDPSDTVSSHRSGPNSPSCAFAQL